jgi:hypothetical protein
MISKPGTFDSLLSSDAHEISAAERALGFPIPKGKTVIHINGNKEDFAIENIYLADQSALGFLRKNIQDIFQELIREKIITFDSFRGAYSKERTPVRRIIVNPVIKQEVHAAPAPMKKEPILDKKVAPPAVVQRKVESKTLTIYVDIDV